MLLSCVPSTTPTPVPVLVKATPELLQAEDAISQTHDFLMAHSDVG